MFNNGQRGTARLTNENNIEQRLDPPRMGRYSFVGLKTDKTSQDCPPHLVVEVDGHLTTIGATRSGKTASQIIPNLVLSECSSVVVDPKGEIAWATAGYLRAAGFKVILLDPFDVINSIYGKLASSNYEQISHFNPIADIDPGSTDFLERIECVVGSMVKNDDKETHWIESVRELAAGLIAYLVINKKETQNLKRFKEIISGGIVDIISIAQSINADNITYGKDSIAWKKLNRYAHLDPNNENREETSIISTAIQQFRFLDDPMINNSMSCSDFSFDELVCNNFRIVIFVILPFELIESYSRWIRLIISMAIKTVSKYGSNLNFPVTIYLDEFGSLGAFPIVSNAFAFMAGRGLRLWIFIQNLGQLKRDYPYDWENFISNSSAISVLKIGDYQTAEYISNLLGITTMESNNGQEYAQSINHGPYMLESNQFQQFQSWLSPVNSSTYARQLMTPDEILRFPDPLGLLITNEHLIVFTKARCYADDPFVDAIRPNPVYL